MLFAMASEALTAKTIEQLTPSSGGQEPIRGSSGSYYERSPPRERSPRYSRYGRSPSRSPDRRSPSRSPRDRRGWDRESSDLRRISDKTQMVSLSVDHMRELTQELSQLDYKKSQLTEKNRVLKAQVTKLKKQLSEVTAKAGEVLLIPPQQRFAFYLTAKISRIYEEVGLKQPLIAKWLKTSTRPKIRSKKRRIGTSDFKEKLNS